MRQAAIIPLAPFGKARPRVTAGHTYMPGSYTKSRAELRTLFGPVTVPPPWELYITAVRHMPASWSKKRRAQMAGRWCVSKPDADNIAGAVMDALFDNDAAVVSVTCRKIWGDDAALEIVITSPQSPQEEQ